MEICFFAAAAWNLTASVKGLLNINENARNFYLAAPGEVTSILASNLYIFWWTVLTFGIGYIIVGLNPKKNHGLVFIAMLGKAFVGVVWIQNYLSGLVNQIALIGAIGDIIFALIFAAFLYNRKQLLN